MMNLMKNDHAYSNKVIAYYIISFISFMISIAFLPPKHLFTLISFFNLLILTLWMTWAGHKHFWSDKRY